MKHERCKVKDQAHRAVERVNQSRYDRYRQGFSRFTFHFSLFTAFLALVLLIVFEMSAILDAWSSARLAAWVQQWQPESTAGVVGRAVADGLVGLTGIFIPARRFGPSRL